MDSISADPPKINFNLFMWTVEKFQKKKNSRNRNREIQFLKGLLDI